MATSSELTTRISEAEARRHELALGLMSYSVAQRSVANRQIDELTKYIEQLRLELSRLTDGGMIVVDDMGGGGAY